MKAKARCRRCGRLTAVNRDGTLHAHYHPGFNTPCKERRPAGRNLRATTPEPSPEELGQARLPAEGMP